MQTNFETKANSGKDHWKGNLPDFTPSAERRERLVALRVLTDVHFFSDPSSGMVELEAELLQTKQSLLKANKRITAKKVRNKVFLYYFRSPLF